MTYLRFILFGLTATFATVFTPASSVTPVAGQVPIAMANKLKWDEPFDGVVHDAERIAGFVGDYRWLSNFYLCRVEWEGRIYGSAEAAYQSGKYPAADRDIFTTLDPDGAKALSLKKPYDKAAWELHKVATMRQVIGAKFTQHADLAQKLIATGERHLEETNWWGDQVWGVYRGVGQNLLGKFLMDLRLHLAKPERGGN